ncbi:Hypothetical protein SCV20265 0531 [Pseudomonas aeruginosa]|nr:Hypothetical protein SCV20265 0531 [Pseudomonas aeruginosa]
MPEITGSHVLPKHFRLSQ